MTTIASRYLRRAEISLWIIGISLLGVALGATFSRWQYQTEQERALFAAMDRETRALVEPAATREAQPSAPLEAVAELIGPPAPLETIGPMQPAAPSDVEPVRPVETVVKKPTPPAAFGRIEIPRIGVRAIVQMGADEKTLARAVGLVPGAAKPGENGNVVLAGHRDTFFWPLRKIEVNDRIRVVVPPHEYEYKVDEVRIVEPDETEVLQSKGVEELTLVTCYPFRFIGPAPDRFIVSASRVQ